MPEYKQVYDSLNLFVQNDLLPYIEAVFDLTARRNISSSERARNLKELEQISIDPSKYQYWAQYSEVAAVKYLKELLKNSKR